jgi:hypothetical protein
MMLSTAVSRIVPQMGLLDNPRLCYRARALGRLVEISETEGQREAYGAIASTLSRFPRHEGRAARL